MNAWFVIVIFGQIAATIGPTDLATCKAVSAQATADIDASYSRKMAEELPPVAGRIVYRNDIYTACFMQPERPALGEKVESN